MNPKQNPIEGEKKRCDIWYCFRKTYRGLQIDIGGHKQVVGWYCKKHTKIADELFKEGKIKTKLPIQSYKGL